MGFAENFTCRYRARYRAAGIEHVIMVRFGRGGSLSAIASSGQAVLHNIFEAVSGFLADDFLWISAEASQEDTDFFSPADVPLAVVGDADWVGDSWSGKKRVSGLTFSGRAPGSRARVTMFGINVDSDFITNDGGNGLVTPDEIPGVADIASILEAGVVANSNQPAFFYGRATHKVNDHLLKLVRRGVIG
jgi:hypothetical protein